MNIAKIAYRIGKRFGYKGRGVKRGRMAALRELATPQRIYPYDAGNLAAALLRGRRAGRKTTVGK